MEVQLKVKKFEVTKLPSNQYKRIFNIILVKQKALHFKIEELL